MKGQMYQFKINGQVLDLEQFYLSVQDLDESELHELLDTSSLETPDGDVLSIEVLS